MISVLLTIEDYWLNRYSIENMLVNSSETEMELLCVNNIADGGVSGFLDEIIGMEKFKNVQRVGEIAEGHMTKPKAFNRLIKESRGEKICIFDALSIVGKNWLYDLNYYGNLVNKCGIVAIAEFSDQRSYTSLIDNNDELVNVWKSEDGSINNGPMLFGKELIESVGGFDERMTGDTFKKQFSIRVRALGYENFYITGQCSISGSEQFNLTTDQKKERDIKHKEYEKMMQSSILEMRKSKNFKVEI